MTRQTNDEPPTHQIRARPDILTPAASASKNMTRNRQANDARARQYEQHDAAQRTTEQLNRANRNNQQQ
jgi:hypothetical protein